MLNPRIALLFDVLLRGIAWAGRPKESTGLDGAYATTGHIGVSGQFFVLDHLWTSVGVGGGFVGYQGPQSSTTSSTANNNNLVSGGGLSLLGGFGYELQHFANAKRNRALSIEARVHGVAVGNSSDWAATIGLGHQWY